MFKYWLLLGFYLLSGPSHTRVEILGSGTIGVPPLMDSRANIWAGTGNGLDWHFEVSIVIYATSSHKMTTFTQSHNIITLYLG